MEYKECSIGGKIYESVNDVRATMKKGSLEDKKQLHEFVLLLAVCHSVQVDKDKKTGKISYQASSPDELALVDGAKDCGIEYVEKYINFIQVADEWAGSTREFETFIEFPFDSTRKRMSLICKEIDTNDLIIYMKGADSIMFPRLNMDLALSEKLEEDLSTFAKKGLRTLVMAKKIITQKVFAEWNEKYTKVNTSNDLNKEDQLAELYDELEYDFEYVGCSAIEDLLQDQVPETIADLMSANIGLWVLTGDKQETAIEIGKSCNLIDETQMELIIMSSKSKDQFIKILTDKLLNPPTKPKMCLVIDGTTLAFVLEDDHLAKAFFQFG